MIVTDLDGTLLRSDLSISNYTKNILHFCQEAGIKTVIATGRGDAEIIAPKELFDGIIANNGANIFVGSIELRRCIPYEEARHLLMLCDERGLRVTSQFGGMHYANFDISQLWPQIKTYEVVDFAFHSLDSEKICIVDITPNDERFIASHLNDDQYMKVARDGLGMIMHSKATKSAAMSELAQRWMISRNEIVAFGDDLNDIDMLEYAGVAVVVANAIDEVKLVADYTCAANDDDGLAKWIEAYILHVDKKI